ncbi:nickel/cobalt transporter [Reinekea forsetii]|nr:nickel/cobalt transporter [Reinekea forsetii]
MKPKLLALTFVAAMLILIIALGWFWSDTILLITDLQTKFHKLLSKHIGQFNEHPITNGIILIGISLLYGVFHAAGPGHGKAVLVTYLSTQKETLKQGVLISFSAAIFQAAVAIAIVTVISVLLDKTFSQANLVSMRTEQSSYVLVMLFGFYFAIHSLLKLRGQLSSNKQVSSHTPTESSSHNHQHEYYQSDQCCNHTYVPQNKISTWQTLGIIASMGARPCTGAVMVLIYAKIIGIYWVGIAATLLMGLGTGLTVAILGFLTIYFRDRISSLVSNNEGSHHSPLASIVLSTLGGTVLIFLGWSLLQASMLPATQHPLF